MQLYRTHNCNQLTTEHLEKTVKLAGWLYRKRDHGNLLFIDIRDHYGLTQCVFASDSPYLALASQTNVETVIYITGKVVARSSETINAQLSTGQIEVQVTDFKVEAPITEELPLAVNAVTEYPEETRLKYRFLDLRRKKLHDNIVMRSQIIKFMRDYLHQQGFNEIQTPILTASSPEGARDYLVPSRLHKGKFYALPQAPQQFKQLLMVAGFDKYFQIAPCFRDEDARADRSPGEFYQLDLEMSFVTQEEIFALVEPLLFELFSKFSTKAIDQKPFPRITYADALLHYGSDKPDLRNPLLINDYTDIFANSGFSIFSKKIAAGAVVRGIVAPKTSDKPRSFFDKMIAFAQEHEAGGLAYINFATLEQAKGPIAKLLTAEELEQIAQRAQLQAGDTIFLICETTDAAVNIGHHVRKKLGEDLELLAKDSFKFCWIVDFPYYEFNPDTKQIDFSHNPFSMPQGGLEALNQAQQAAEPQKALLELKAYQYDIVCNGIELSSGAIRNNLPELMLKAFAIAGYSQETVEDKFSGMLNAFRYGAPPHGGIAPGVDRIVMLLADEPNIREVICFPMNQKAQDLMMQAPSEVDSTQLREFDLTFKKKK